MRTFTMGDLHHEARSLWRYMSLTRAATMLGVAPGSVARWRDGALFTDDMALCVAQSIVARDMGMVGVFGRVDTGGRCIEARMDSHGVVVRVISNHNERSRA